MVGVEAIDRSQNTIFDAVPLEQPKSMHYFVEGRPAFLVPPISIVEVARPIDADTDKKILLFEEDCLFAVQERPVGLHGVDDGHPRATIFFHEFYSTTIKVKAHQGRFPSLPRDVHMVRPMGLHDLADVLLQDGLAHPQFAPWIERFLIEVEAVDAI